MRVCNGYTEGLSPALSSDVCHIQVEVLLWTCRPSTELYKTSTKIH